jgi:rfaE bifunctional protein kinase chain/domain
MPPAPAVSEATPDRLLAIVDRFVDARLAVVGDLLADEFIYGRVERVSREAPVLILRYDSTVMLPGGAGNAANNAASLGGRVQLAALVGRDEPGRRVVNALHAKVSRAALVSAADYRTPVKTRILAGGVHSAKQQVVRIDRVVNGPVAELRRRVENAAMRACGTADAVLVSDYGSGLVTPDFAERLRRRVWRNGAARRRIPILVDSRHALASFRDATACTPNESEAEQVLGTRIGDDAAALERAGRALLRKTRMQAVLITRGSRGMALFEPGRPTRHIPIFGSDEIADVTGAGDTVVATVALSLAVGATFYEAARLANYAGGIVVMKRGTASVAADELGAAIRRDLTSVVRGARL